MCQPNSQVIQKFDILVDATSLTTAEPPSPYVGHQVSDYVLLGKNSKPLAVVGAKKTSRDPVFGREQAKKYCHNIQKQLGGELPSCFYTNGHDHYFWDLGNYPPRKIIGYTPPMAVQVPVMMAELVQWLNSGLDTPRCCSAASLNFR